MKTENLVSVVPVGSGTRSQRWARLCSFGAIAGIVLALVTACQDPIVDDEPASAQPTYNPVYEVRRHYIGLDEWIVIHKGPDGYYCVREDGRKQSCVELKNEEEAAYFEKYGVMTQGLWNICLVTPPDEAVPAGVAYHVDEPPGLLSTDKAELKRAREEYRQRVLAKGEEWLPRLREMGATPSQETLDPTMPLIFVSAKCDVLRAVARLSGINQVMYGGSGKPISTSGSGPTNSVAHTSADIIFNDYGHYGAGVKVGIVPASSEMRLFGDHKAFAYGPPVVYKSPASLCFADEDCSGEDGAQDHEYRCMARACVSPHETATASVIATGRNDGKYNAAAAQLYFFNEGQKTYDGTFSSVACTKAIAAAYRWFAENDVDLVNESYDCLQPYYNAPD